jgi:hypothetical protein
VKLKNRVPGCISAVMLGLIVLAAGIPGYGETDAQLQQGWTVLDVYDALRGAYGDRVHNMGWEFGEVFFTLDDQRIYYAGGRMLRAEHLTDSDQYGSVLYRYRCGPFVKLPDPVPYQETRSTDFLDAMIGSSPEQIQFSSRWVDFLDHRIFMHELCVDALQRIDTEIREAALTSKEAADYLGSIKIIFSTDRRKVEGSESLSYHAYGLAMDIVPQSYEGKQVYWRWTSAWNSGWKQTPLSGRWQPPDLVIEIFEKNGFVWGGKWYHFDTIHFEYRPEIIYLNRLRSSAEISTE